MRLLKKQRLCGLLLATLCMLACAACAAQSSSDENSIADAPPQTQAPQQDEPEETPSAPESEPEESQQAAASEPVLSTAQKSVAFDAPILLEFANPTASTWSYRSGFSLYAADSDEPIPYREGLSWNPSVSEVEPNQCVEIELTLSTFFDALSAGDYRIAFEVENVDEAKQSTVSVAIHVE